MPADIASSKTSQAQEGKYGVISFTCGIPKNGPLEGKRMGERLGVEGKWGEVDQ